MRRFDESSGWMAWSKNEFSHSLALQRTAAGRRGRSDARGARHRPGRWLWFGLGSFGAKSLSGMRMFKLTALIFSLALNAAEVSRVGGIGVVLGVEGRDIVVKGVLPDTPA